MKPLKKVAAGLLLTVGALFLMVPVAVLAREEATPRDRLDARAGLIFGMGAIAWGSYLTWGLYHQTQAERRDRLQATFYRLLQEGKGKVTVMHLAMEARLPASQAQQYLDEQARTFDATFDVSEEGGIFYTFIL
jgi:large subunit ribosomal protein L7/L12